MERHDPRGRDVAGAQVERRPDPAGQHQHLPVGDAEGGEEAGERLGLRPVHRDRVHHQQVPLAGPGVERRAAGQLAHLLRHLGPVVAGLRPEDRPAPAPVRRPGRSLPGPAGALLAPRLLVAARDEAAGPGGGGALPLVAQEGLDRLVQHRLVHGAIKQLRRQRERRLVAGSARGEMGRLKHDGSLLPAWPPSRCRSCSRGSRPGRTAGCARHPPAPPAGPSRCGAGLHGGRASSSP